MVVSRRYFFSFVLLTFLVGFCDASIFQQKRTFVRIINEVGEDIDLNFHCKSKDDDLGPHVLTPHQYYEFNFRPNFFWTTLFFCRFWWGNESHWFDIYDVQRDGVHCTTYCWWQVFPTGPCFRDPYTHKYTRCKNWNTELQGSGNNTAPQLIMTPNILN